MTVRQAVEKVEGTSAKVDPAKVIRASIERQTRAFAAVLPRGSDRDAERFARLVLSAVKATPDLMRCFETAQGEVSVLLAAMQAAAVDLEPNTATQDAWLLPRRDHGVWECRLAIGYRGYQRLARRSGTIKTLYAEAVRQGDHFVWERGLEADLLEFRPSDEHGDEGELTHAFAVVRYVNGGYNFVVLNRRQVEARRALADSWTNVKARPYSPWTKWPEAMWRKSAVRALVPYLDLSSSAAHAFAADEARLTLDDDGTIMLAEATDAGAFVFDTIDKSGDVDEPAFVSSTATELPAEAPLIPLAGDSPNAKARPE